MCTFVTKWLRLKMQLPNPEPHRLQSEKEDQVSIKCTESIIVMICTITEMKVRIKLFNSLQSTKLLK